MFSHQISSQLLSAMTWSTTIHMASIRMLHVCRPSLAYDIGICNLIGDTIDEYLYAAY
jgi:hypothetical protein